MDPQDNIQQLSQQVSDLSAVVQHLLQHPQGNLGPTAAASGDSKHLRKPPEFDGKDKSFCSTFISHLTLYISGNPSLFPDDHSKVLFAASYLRGAAFAWFEPHLLSPQDDLLHNFNLFKEELLKNLGDPDRKRNITRQLQSLTQLGSAASYSSQFFKLSAFLDWNEGALQAQFYSGLKSEVKDALALLDHDATTLNDLSSTAIRLDNRLHERRMEHKRTSPSKTFRPINFHQIRPTLQTPAATTAPVPMEIDGIQSKFKVLTPEEKKRRQVNNLCMYCGQPGHHAINCPSKRTGNKFPKSASISATSPTNSQTNGQGNH
jgi:hypothetical protein